ncbi:MAG: hypothetical protein ABIG10_02075 [bacterium]
MNKKMIRRIVISVFTPVFLVALFLLLFFICEKDCFLPAHAADSPDAIGIRVMPNPDHRSPLSWYNKNIENKGSPMSIIVNGYEAVRDGRSVYVNAANIERPPAGDKLFTNIYIISYNQESEEETRDIFGQILKYWKFNVDLVRDYGDGACLPIDNQACEKNDCIGNFRGYNCENNVCVKKCLLDSDCKSEQYCNSAKSQLVRDVKRLADIFEINLAIQLHKQKNGSFPSLPSGSYLPDKTISVWPSWNENLGQTLGYQLPLDPVNRLDNCPGFDPITCWNEEQKLFATSFGENGGEILPEDPETTEVSLAYVYVLDQDNGRYKFCTNFETSYPELPDEHRCDEWIGKLDEDIPYLLLGNCVRPEGEFNKCFIAAYGKYDIDWSKTKIEPADPANWAGWVGWQWTSGQGLSLSNTSLKSHKELVAKKVILPDDKYYGMFKYFVTVYDIHGNSNKLEGVIKICNPVTCEDKGYECSSPPSPPPSDNCGGFLACGRCEDGKRCINYKCE